jgi:chemosensory pili system protein ChpA (sensor histidine kinase/response regulator)
VVAEIGLNCARLAQGNSQMGCGLAEFDLNLRHLRQQLRRLESEAEATVQERARSGGADQDSTLRQGIPGLREVLTQLVDLRDQLASYQRESAELLAHQTRLADALQDGHPSGRTAGAT